MTVFIYNWTQLDYDCKHPSLGQFPTVKLHDGSGWILFKSDSQAECDPQRLSRWISDDLIIKATATFVNANSTSWSAH